MTAFYEAEQVAAAWSEQLLDWGDDFHDLLLADRLRMRAYQAAIAEAVRPGDVVVDVGTGTGVLARWALEAGAARAYGIERDPALLERATSATAGAPGEFVPVPGLSFDVTLAEPADLVVSEILGNLVDNEGSTAILADAARRFLRPGGVMLPQRAERYLVPVEAPVAHTAVAGGSSDGGEGASPFDAYYDVILPRSGYLASPRLDRAFEPGDATDTYARELVFPLDRAGRLHGFKGWFVADLSPTVALDIGGDRIEPASARTTSDSWRHAYLPIAEPVDVEPFDRLALRFARRAGGPGDPFGQSYRWSGAVWRGATLVARFDQHT